ncbi:MAG: NAD(P)-dependent oxidoreductase [Actinobacteria bacterium]|nr:NAD(P)-dependent oxidoreductase [Actinomycetota bacterium]
MPHKQALLTGATGFVASHLLPALLADGWSVRACGRRPRPDWFPQEVDYRSVDLARPEGLDALYEGVTHLFHLAGASSSTSTDEEMHRGNVVATRNLLAAAPATLARVVHMSSTSVYGEEVQLPVPVPEDVQPHPSRGYGKAKWEAEQEMWAKAEAGMAVVVLRPVSTFGPGNVKLLGSAVLDTAIEAWAGLATLAVAARPVEQRLVHIDDLVGASLHLAEHEEAVGHAYNVVAEQYPSSHDVARILAGAFGMEVELDDQADCGLAYEDRAAIHAQMLEHGMAPHIFLTEQRFRFMAKENRNNRLRVDALLGTGFRFAHSDLEPAIQTTIDWYREHRWVITR